MDLPNPERANPPRVTLNRSDQQTMLLEFSGDWKLDLDPPPAGRIQEALETAGQYRRIAFDTGKLVGWDSSLLSFLTKVYDYCSRKNIEKLQDGLPQGLVRLLALATAVPEKEGAGRLLVRTSFLFKVGTETVKVGQASLETVAFVGEAFLAFLKLLRGKARFRRSDLALLMQTCGAGALPIVSLISVLVGLILAFVGAVQLRMFGAQIYVADLVGLGMAREMGAMMTAVIMAGRTGAAFAAQLGTMQVNEEIDALRTMGISPMEFLVIPRMLALAVMMPLLCLYADLMGMLGGAVVGIGMLHLSPAEYYNETMSALHLADFGVGLVKGAVFGVLVALSGCLRGIQCGRSASAVGDATTSAVVTSIVLIIVSDAILTVIYDILGI